MGSDKEEDLLFEGLLREQIPSVYNMAFRFCSSASTAEDLAQTTLLTAWEKRKQLAAPDMPQPLPCLSVAALLGLSLSSVKSHLHRARKNLSAFFGHHCQWILPENSCRCAAWTAFCARRETLREEVRKHGGPPDFSDPEFAAGSDPETMAPVIACSSSIIAAKENGNDT